MFEICFIDNLYCVYFFFQRFIICYHKFEKMQVNLAIVFVPIIYIKIMINLLFSDANHGDISFIGYCLKAHRRAYVIDWYNVSSMHHRGRPTNNKSLLLSY